MPWKPIAINVLEVSAHTVEFSIFLFIVVLAEYHLTAKHGLQMSLLATLLQSWKISPVSEINTGNPNFDRARHSIISLFPTFWAGNIIIIIIIIIIMVFVVLVIVIIIIIYIPIELVASGPYERFAGIFVERAMPELLLLFYWLVDASNQTAVFLRYCPRYPLWNHGSG